MTVHLTSAQRVALRRALAHGYIRQEHPAGRHTGYRALDEAAAVTLESLRARGLLHQDESQPRYMPRYVLTDAGRKRAETL